MNKPASFRLGNRFDREVTHFWIGSSVGVRCCTSYGSQNSLSSAPYIQHTYLKGTKLQCRLTVCLEKTFFLLNSTTSSQLVLAPGPRKMVSRRDFRVVMLYEFKLNHSAAEAARDIALAFGTDSPSERTVMCWFAKFSSGDFDLEDKPGRGRRMSLDDQALRAAVETNPDTTTRTLTAGLWFTMLQFQNIWPPLA
ncbi:hypothetical protein Y032_0644g1069 [Ancylostoma ceylanicum]|uniref:Mos1 transposase HTH domain-containing protein n=1 Tax=Ancylostoma ceylanicum TaxID=53326 RepID=A0A016WK77_9BILA|nr:hypothetical protein Y032_0644g1069 [Ancylostoma ceylanicum]